VIRRQTQAPEATPCLSEDRRRVSRSRDRRHLPEVRCLSAESDVPIVDTLVYLTSAFRSQGFSPSQRFDPGTPSRLCFKSHPLVGFSGLQSFSRHGQSSCLSTLAALLPSGAPRTRAGRADRVYGVRRVCPDEPDVDARHTPGDPGFRALLRPGVRHFERRVSATRSRCSLGLCPLRGLPTRPLGLTPPLVHLPACRLRRGAANGASGCQSGRAWARRPREPRQPP
jgi:hypothetical protein